jgi:hypothetical protein
MAKSGVPVVVDYDETRPKGVVIDGARELMEDFEAANPEKWWTLSELEVLDEGNAD